MSAALKPFAPCPFPYDELGVEICELKTFEDFSIEVLKRIQIHGFLWRGSGVARRSILSSAFRAELDRLKRYGEKTGEQDDPSSIVVMSEHVQDRMELARRPLLTAIGSDPHLRIIFRQELSTNSIDELGASWDEVLSVGRHFGMANTLIDITESPYVALYFAAKDCLDKGSETPFGVWQIPAFNFRGGETRTLASDEDPVEVAKNQSRYSNANVGREAVKVTVRSFHPRIFRSDRLIAQRGAFLRVEPDLPLDHVLPLMYQNEVKEWTLAQEMRLYTLPASEAVLCLMHLNKMNINPRTLFPDMSGEMDDLNLAASHFDYQGLGENGRGTAFMMFNPTVRRD